MNNIDKSWKGFYKISGISSITGAAFFIAGLVMNFIIAIPPDSTTAEQLEILAKNSTLFQLGNIAVLLSDVFSALAILGIYFSLHMLKKGVALTGSALYILGASLAVMLHILEQGHVYIAGNFLQAIDEIHQFQYITAFELLKSITTNGYFIANLLIGAGFLTIGIAMLSGVYNRKTAWLVIFTSIVFITGCFAIIFTWVPAFILLAACFLSLICSTWIGLRLIAIDLEIT